RRRRPSQVSVAPVLDHLHNAYLGGADKRRGGLPRSPQLGHCDLEPLGVGQVVELKVDGDVVGIIDRPKHAMAAHPGLLPMNWIAIKGGLPEVEIPDRMLESEDGHSSLLDINYSI